MGAQERDPEDTGVAELIAGNKRPLRGKQVVIRGIESGSEVILEPYGDPTDETPDWKERFKFPTVLPAPKNIVQARRLVNDGVSFRSN